MPPTDLSYEEGLLEFSFGSVWLVGASDHDQLPPLAFHALATADVVIYEPGVSAGILELVRPPRYRELALTDKAIERAIKLAQDGWRIVRLAERDPLERHDAVEWAAKLSDHGIPLRIIPITSEPLLCEAPIAMLKVCKPRLVSAVDIRTSDSEPGLVFLFILATPSKAQFGNCSTTSAQRHRAPCGFSMSGLAG